jgi:hypothetical protein
LQKEQFTLALIASAASNLWLSEGPGQIDTNREHENVKEYHKKNWNFLSLSKDVSDIKNMWLTSSCATLDGGSVGPTDWREFGLVAFNACSCTHALEYNISLCSDSQRSEHTPLTAVHISAFLDFFTCSSSGKLKKGLCRFAD